MAAQNTSASSDAQRQSKPSSADTTKVKRARTKHACDECRRSQKKCDGDKPLCRRCYLNGTNCTYTPHKSRNQCLCIGQGEEPPVDASAPDVFIFADPSLNSFHTWSATTSPDQSPSACESALNNSSATDLSQDVRFGSARNAVLELPASLYESEIIPAPDMILRNRSTYESRCYSLPNSPSTSSISSSPHATGSSPIPASAFLPKNYIGQPIPTGLESGHVSQLNTREAFHPVVGSPFPSNDSRVDPAQFPKQYSAPDYRSYFDTPTQCNQTSSDAQFYQAESSPYPTELADARSPYYPSCLRQHSMGPAVQGCLSSDTAPQVSGYPTGFSQSGFSLPLVMNGNANEGHPARSYGRISGQSAGRAAVFPCSQRTVDFAGVHERRQIIGMTLPKFPSHGLHNNQWSVGIASPELTGSYPSSANPSPSCYSPNDFYDWSQQP